MYFITPTAFSNMAYDLLFLSWDRDRLRVFLIGYDAGLEAGRYCCAPC